MAQRNGLRRCTREACKICGQKNDWCFTLDDGAVHGCMTVGSEKGPDGFEFIKRGKGESWLFRPVGAAGDPVAPRRTRSPADVERERRDKKAIAERASAIWHGAVAGHPVARQYLLGRGLPCEGPPPCSMRFTERCGYRDDDGSIQDLPAIVCAVTPPKGDADSPVSAVHRLYLDPESLDANRDVRSAKVTRRKKLLGEPGAGAVRLDFADIAGRTLVVAEGVETAYACQAALRAAGDATAVAWATISTSGLRSVDVPLGDAAPRRILIAADNDAPDKKGRPPGLIAAKFAAKRLRLNRPDGSVKVCMPRPPDDVTLDREAQGGWKSWDWADAVKRFGAASVGRTLEAAFAASPPPSVTDAGHMAGAGGSGGAGDDGGGPTMPAGGAGGDESRASRRGRWWVYDDPMDQARQCLLLAWTDPQGRATLRWWSDSWWVWSGPASARGQRWVQAKGDWLRAEVRKWLDRFDLRVFKEGAFTGEYKRLKSTDTKAADISAALRALTYVGGGVEGEAEAPCWIDRFGRVVDGVAPARRVVAFRNVLIDAAAWRDGERRVIAHTPDWFSAVCLPFDLPDEAQPRCEAEAWRRAPVFRRFMEETFAETLDLDEMREGATPQIDTTMEWFGYCSVPDTSLQKMLCIQGDPGTGKGTLLRVFVKLFGGEGQTASTTLSQLGNSRFGLQRLLGRLVAVIPDAESVHGDDARRGAEFLKMIVGEDSVGVDKKGVTDIPATKLMCRFTVCMNKVVKIPDAAGAFQRRMIWLHTPRRVSEPDPRLEEKLEAELPWIAVLALEGLRRLHDRGDFQTTDHGRRLAAQFREQSSALVAFVRDCCALDPELVTKKADLRACYRQWCTENDEDPLGERRFGEELLGMGLGIAADRVALEGVRTPVYRGIKPTLTPPPQSDLPGV